MCASAAQGTEKACLLGQRLTDRGPGKGGQGALPRHFPVRESAPAPQTLKKPDFRSSVLPPKSCSTDPSERPFPLSFLLPSGNLRPKGLVPLLPPQVRVHLTMPSPTRHPITFLHLMDTNLFLNLLSSGRASEKIKLAKFGAQMQKTSNLF